MTKFRSSIVIFGCVVLCIAAGLGTFFALSAVGLIVTDPIELTVTVEDETKVYDGTPLSATSYRLTSGELLEDHTIVPTYVGSQTEVGDSDSGMRVAVVDKDGYDVTKQYTVKVNTGILEVLPRPLILEQESITAEYSGQPIACGEYSVTAGELCTGHRVVTGMLTQNCINVGRYPDINTPTLSEPQIYDAAGNNVTYNYEIESTEGTLEITPREIDIAPVSRQKVYDGIALTASDYTIVSGSLVAGDVMSVSYASINSETPENISIVNAGTLQVYLVKNSKIVYNRNGENVSDNYVLSSGVESRIATLTVTQADMPVMLNSYSMIYGEEIPDIQIPSVSVLNNDALQIDEFVDIVYLADVKYGDLTTADVGTYNYTVHWKTDDDEVVAGDDEAYKLIELRNNYNLVVTAGNITVVKKTVSFDFVQREYTYAEKPEDWSWAWKNVLENWEGNDSSDSDDDTSSRNDFWPRFVSNFTLVYPQDDTLSAGSYTYTARWRANADPSAQKNYDVSIGIGTLLVKRKEITLVATDLKSESKEYDGEVYMPLAENLVLNNDYKSLLQVSAAEIRNAGTYAYTVSLIDTINYTLAGVTTGTVTVTKKNIETKAFAQEENWYYTGSVYTIPVTAVLQEAQYANLVEIVSTEMRNAGTYTYTVRLLDTLNYTLNDENTSGEVVIYKQSITLKAYTQATWTYTGEVYSILPIDVVENVDQAGLVEVVTTEMRNAGTYTYTVRVLDTLNYAVTGEYTSGTVTIDKQEIKVKKYTLAAEWEYTGNEYTILAEDVVENATQANLVEVVSSALRNAGTYTYTVRVRDASNYTLTGEHISGEVTIKKAEINIKDLTAFEEVYSGEVYTIPTMHATDAAFADKIVIDAPVIRDAGVYGYTVRLLDTNNYTMTGKTSGTFTIVPKPIYLQYSTDNKVTKVYDGERVSLNSALIKLYDDDAHDNENNALIVASARVDAITVLLDKGQPATRSNVRVTDVVLRDAAGTDVTKNYDVSGWSVDVCITKRVLNISIQDLVITREEWESVRNNLTQYVTVTVSNLATGDYYAQENVIIGATEIAGTIILTFDGFDTIGNPILGTNGDVTNCYEWSDEVYGRVVFVTSDENA